MLPKMFYEVQFNHIKCLVPNWPGAKLSEAKLSWCQIVRVPNCPLLLSWCQIVRFIILVPNCPVPNCPVPNCPVPNCPTINSLRCGIFVNSVTVSYWARSYLSKCVQFG